MDDATLTHAFTRAKRIVDVGNQKDATGKTYAEQLIKDLTRLTHPSITSNEQGLEYCEDCGAGEGELYEEVCTAFSGDAP